MKRISFCCLFGLIVTAGCSNNMTINNQTNAQKDLKECQQQPLANDGSPHSYMINACMGDKEFNKKNYTAAATYYTKALNETLFRQPNYHLKYNLGVSLCNSLKTQAGITQLKEFVQTAKAQLAMIPCPIPRKDGKQIGYSLYACAGDPMVLTNEGKSLIKQKIISAESEITTCSKGMINLM